MLVSEKGNLNAITDAGTAALLSIAAISSAGANTKINLQSLLDEKVCAMISRQLQEIEKETQKLDQHIRAQIKSRSKMSKLIQVGDKMTVKLVKE